ncbi:EAL domain-containing protein [Acidovorax sp. GBBC 3334]|uniref:putative bifunctional diguanylate cyclase/phosphodiesterase n=1 Tax=Acidovorax sp. GBBC 3334 TaxID=2940496 RepID=UPI0023034C5C|nr:EAL domain-containing protein [Acidovorax sp. GBBC 3334]MDA8454539.1 EAL domain-containing protein [Acidovorax sp. GBBC 3334]
MSTRIAWIDAAPAPERAAAAAALAVQGAEWGHTWEVVPLPWQAAGTPPGARGRGADGLSGPGAGFESVVLAPDRHATTLPAWAVQPGRRLPVLLSLGQEPAQEALAARALRAGPGDYVLTAGQGDGTVRELALRLVALLESRPGSGMDWVRDAAVRPEGPAAWSSAGAAPAELLQTALDHMALGLLVLGPDDRVRLYNARLLDMLELPRSVLDGAPTLSELTLLQARRGDFGEDFARVDDRGRPHVESGASLAAPGVYWRRTHDGRTLEVYTTTLPGGGLLRTFSDVTPHTRLQAELRLSEARFRSLSDLSSDWYWEQDADYRFVHFTGGSNRLRMAASEIVGRTRWELGALNFDESDWAAHRRLLDAREPFRDLELQRAGSDGSPYWVAVSGVPVFGGDGAFLGYRGVGRDISERKRVEAEIERLAFFDVLTGLPNRRLLTDRLQRALGTAAREEAHGAVLFLDLDNFKDLNDTLGHDMGDRLLEQAAQRLLTCARPQDTVCRFGGDEFVVLAEGLPGDVHAARAEAAVLAHRIVAALGKPYAVGRMGYHYSTPSIGLTLFGGRQGTEGGVDDLLKQADLAMYQAKAAGRNTVRFFNPAMQAAVNDRAALESELRHALRSDELVLHYQPIVDSGGRMLGAEALVRWRHPQRGMVLPGEFIPVAEQGGLIVPLGQWVLERGCEQLVAWSRSPATAQLSLAVNVSVRQFRQPDFVDHVLQAVRRSGAQPRLLKIELTESLLMVDVEEVIARMEQLRAHGVGFAIDDFGTGYSSLAYLKRLPLDQLKIDQSFVRDVLTDPNDAAIVRTILALAQSLDLRVVAEGVETTGQLQFLQRHGCHAFQGHLFGRPAPAAVLERALRPAL